MPRKLAAKQVGGELPMATSLWESSRRAKIVSISAHENQCPGLRKPRSQGQEAKVLNALAPHSAPHNLARRRTADA